jgi:hypothetical protein
VALKDVNPLVTAEGLQETREVPLSLILNIASILLFTLEDKPDRTKSEQPW